MSGFTTARATAILQLYFQAVPDGKWADDDAGGPVTAIHCALHTADPDAGDMTTSESAYTGYARVTTDRGTTGVSWDVASGQADNDGAVTFPASTSGPESETHVSLGDTATDEILVSGSLTATLVVNNGITPSFADASLVITLTTLLLMMRVV